MLSGCGQAPRSSYHHTRDIYRHMSPLPQHARGSICEQVIGESGSICSDQASSQTFLCAMDQTVIVSLNPLIGSQLQALDLASWVATAYFLTLASIQPAYGKLCDVFGRKECPLFCYAVFGLGCVLCGIAQTMTQLIVARLSRTTPHMLSLVALYGVLPSTSCHHCLTPSMRESALDRGEEHLDSGVEMDHLNTSKSSSKLVPISKALAVQACPPSKESVIVSDIVPQKDCGLWQGFINMVFTLGCASGSLFGNLVAEFFGWRWVFLSQVPLCMFAIVVCLTLLELPDFSTVIANQDDTGTAAATRPRSRLAALRRVDFLGMALLAAGIATLIYGLQHGGGVAWDSRTTVGFLAGSAACLALYLVVEALVAAEPVTPCRLLLAQFGVLAGSFLAGWAMRRVGGYYWITVAGYACFAISLEVGIVGMVQEDPAMIMVGGIMDGVLYRHDIAWTEYVSLPSPPFSVAVLRPPPARLTCLGVVTNASAEDMATVTAINYLMRSIGSAVGVSIASTVVQNSLRWGIAVALELDTEQAEAIANGARKDLDLINTLPHAIQLIVRCCYGLAVKDSTVAMLVTIVLALCRHRRCMPHGEVCQVYRVGTFVGDALV
jgi:MFS family permease